MNKNFYILIVMSDEALARWPFKKEAKQVIHSE